MTRKDIRAGKPASLQEKATTAPRSKSPAAFGGVNAFRDLYAPPTEPRITVPTEPEPATVSPPARPRRLRQTLSGTVICLLLLASTGLLWANNMLLAQTYGGITGQRVQAAPRPAILNNTAQAAASGSIVSLSEVPPTALHPTLAIILDSSSRMRLLDHDSDQTRWSITRNALAATFDSAAIPSDALLTMSAFGQRGAGCADQALLQALEPFSFERAYNAIYDVRPGPDAAAPLDTTLRSTIAQLADASGPATIVLITGGGNTCGGDPVATAAAWSADSSRRVTVIAVSPQAENEGDQLRAIARAGHGDYFEASSSDSLAAVLRLALGTTD